MRYTIESNVLELAELLPLLFVRFGARPAR
jgi:hypothetical protein